MSRALAGLLDLAPAPRGRLLLAVVLGALTVCFGVALMALAGYLITRAAERPAVLSLMVAIVGVRFFGLGRPLLRYLERLSSHDVALRVLGRVRRRLYERIEPLAPAGVSGYRRGDLLARMVADVDALQGLYLRVLAPPAVAVIAGAVCVGVTFAVLPVAGLVLAAGLLIGGGAVPALSGFLSARATRRQAAARGALSAEIVELVGGAPELVAFGAERSSLERLTRADAALVGLARRDALATGLGDGLTLVVTGLTVCGVTAAAVAASAEGKLGRVLVAMLGLLALSSFEAVTALGPAAREFLATRAAGGRILDITERDADVRDPAEPTPGPVWPFAVELDNVRVRYPGQAEPVFDGVSFRIEPGERVALLGPSGAGKTTVVNLLLRFLDPEGGRVSIGGQELRRYGQEDVRRAIAVAGQDSHLFSASLRENVRLGRPQASDGEIEDTLRRARLWEWAVQLPNALDTHLGEGGRELSGGQRQRIVLARALLADRPFLVLDEPTAHLDSPTAAELVRDVLRATPEKSVLLITHRTEGLDQVDRIVALPAARSIAVLAPAGGASP